MVPVGLLLKNMDISVFAFLMCGVVAMAFGYATLRLELDLAATARRRVLNDSSLSAQSVNWLGGISLAGALIVCCLTQ